MTPLARSLALVVVSMLVGAAIGAGLVRRSQPPPSVVESRPAAPPAVPAARYTAIDPATLPGWSEDSVAEALPALKRSCTKLGALPSESIIGQGEIARPARTWQAACDGLAQLGDGDAAVRAALSRDFVAYRVAAAKNQDQADERGTFTGYYEADLKGSLTQGGPYHVPIYGKPRDLVTVNLRDFLPPSAALPTGVPASLVGRVDPVANQLKPYYTRAEIDAEGAIAGDADVLLWADDPVAVHILHIQGSGRVTLPDGQVMRIGFAGSNGRAFKGIGSILLESGALKPGGASMTHVREWLQQRPAEAARYMNQNTRYIFFRKLDPAETEDGPVGALGVSLTPLRSMAVDPRFVPLGAPVWLDTADPDGVPLKRLMAAQDVGAAITGAVRGDIFWGAGEEAFSKAGRMKSGGGYVVFVPRAAN